MKPLLIVRVIARPLACALILLGSGIRAELLQNGDMSAGQAKPDAWTQMWVGMGKLGSHRDEAVFRSAPASLRLAARDGSAKGQIYQSIPAAPGERFTASGWLKCEGADTTAQIGLQFFNSLSAPLGFTQVRYVAGNKDWTEGKATVTAPAGSARVAYVLLLDGDGQAWLDDAVITRSGEPSATPPVPAPPAPSSPPQAEVTSAALEGEGTLIAVIADFRKQNFTYGYEGWKDLAAVTQRTPEGLLLTGPAAGGGGMVYGSPAPLDGATHVRLRYIRNEGNTAWTLYLKLMGSPESTVTFDLSGPNPGRLESKLLPLPIKRANRITQVQFQGTFSPAERFNLTLVDAAFVKMP